MYLFINGSFTKKEDIQISPFDHGFMYGLGLFETFRTYKGHPFLLDDHFQRLTESAETMNINMPKYNRDETKEIIEELLRLNNMEDAYFRWNVSAGERNIGLSTDQYEQPNTIIYVKPLSLAVNTEKKARTLTIRRNSPEGEIRLKSHHYLNNILGKRELGDAPGEEGIFLTAENVLSEGLVSNIFWLKNEKLFTPDLSCGCLNGITRQFLIALAEKQGISVEMGRYPVEMAIDADEVMVTNSVQGLVPINQWESKVFPGNKGNWFRWANEQYQQQASCLWSKQEL
ncbi:aminodeoxychorismate lyase [Salipaludibacillus sp. HK11]|uniref:aminodeoxychorismate lyase n=1 Tax=Salipaludibacillus sp. HK11 TaxID=3394320 RepID=UPI0039FBFF00